MNITLNEFQHGVRIIAYFAIFEILLCIYIGIREKIWKHKILKADHYIKLADKIKGMSPRRFEYFCRDLYIALGHKAYATAASADGGKDVVVDEKIYVECKHYLGNTKVSYPTVLKLNGICALRKKKGVIFTTGRLTINAKEFCMEAGIEIIDMDRIMDMCRQIGNERVLRIAGMKYED